MKDITKVLRHEKKRLIDIVSFFPAHTVIKRNRIMKNRRKVSKMIGEV